MNLLIAGVLLVASQETAENPEYRSWASFKTGTTVKLKEVTEAAGTKTVAESQLTLIEVNDQKLIVEARVVRFSGGNKAEMPVERREIAARIPKEDLKPRGSVLREGVHELQIAGRRLVCQWTEVREAANILTQTWTCPDVPGGLVQRETRIEGPTPSTVRLEVVDWTLPS